MVSLLRYIIFIHYSEPEDVQMEDGEERLFALVINGHSLVHALHTELEYKFVELCTKCKYLKSAYFFYHQMITGNVIVLKYVFHRQSGNLLPSNASSKSNGGAAH